MAGGQYFTPLECPRIYFGEDNYCCPNNYRRIISELPLMVYYRARRELAVNLYTPSTAKLDLGDGLWSPCGRRPIIPPRGTCC